MAEITSDIEWSRENQQIKTLTLEHHMAAKGEEALMIFLNLFTKFQITKQNCWMGR